MKCAHFSGYAVLFLGVSLLVATFLVAYCSLQINVNVSDIEHSLTDALGPLITACIKAMFLGVMGWVGSILTVRGVALLKEPAKEPVKGPNQKQKPCLEKVE